MSPITDRKKKREYDALQRKAHPETKRQYDQARYLSGIRTQRDPAKQKSRKMAANAIRDGRLVRQPCEVCGTVSGVQAHHDDYDRPLDVRWLCQSDHMAAHGRRFPL
jgi:hypothetical protein